MIDVDLLADAAARCAGGRVLVVGDAMLDVYTQGAVRRLCPEAPVPVLDAAEEEAFPGGAANVAGNLAALGASVAIVSAVGDDCDGERLLELLTRAGVDASRTLRCDDRATIVKQRILSDAQMLVRIDRGGTRTLDWAESRTLADAIVKLAPKHDAIVVSDYGRGSITPEVVAALHEVRDQVFLAIDAKRLSDYASLRPDLVKPNRREAAALLGIEPPVAEPADFWAGHAERLLELTGARIVAVTLDRDGCVCLERGRDAIHVPARPKTAPSVAGAGDTFLSMFSLALAAGLDVETTAHLANVAASVVIDETRTATCSATQLADALRERHARPFDRARLIEVLEGHRRRGRKIVLTNGCFDILHSGHVEYLRRARALGDLLVVAVNGDDGIRRLKGEGRPINTLADRLSVLGGLSCVDYLTAFDENTPDEVIKAVRPDVFVKGGDYTRERLPEAELVERLGGVVRILPFVADRSTTNIINRIRTAERNESDRRDKTAAPTWPQHGVSDAGQPLVGGPQHFVH